MGKIIQSNRTWYFSFEPDDGCVLHRYVIVLMTNLFIKYLNIVAVDGAYVYQRIKKEGSKIADYEGRDLHMRFLPAMEFEKFKYRCHPCKDDYCKEKMGKTDFIFAESGLYSGVWRITF